MKPAFLLLLAWLLAGCVAPGSRASDSRDYAITTCEAKPQEIELVQKRARNYFSRHASSAAEVRFLAVTADSIFPSEVQDLWIKLGRSQTSSSAYAQWRDQSSKLWCVLLVDRSTQLALTNQGYVLANTPARGQSFKSEVIARSILEQEAQEFSNCFPSEISKIRARQIVKQQIEAGAEEIFPPVSQMLL